MDRLPHSRERLSFEFSGLGRKQYLVRGKQLRGTGVAHHP
jgi:hypothetical protein